MWHLIEENTMTVGVPFSRQFRKIITSDLYGIGDKSDRKFTTDEIARMQVSFFSKLTTSIARILTKNDRK